MRAPLFLDLLYVVESYKSNDIADILKIFGGSWPPPDCEQLSFLLVVIVKAILANFLHIILQLNSLRSHPKEACIGCKSQAFLQYTHDPLDHFLSLILQKHSATVPRWVVIYYHMRWYV